ncbi:hypothetical protein ISCGN_016626 [Ixodes scapularis]
MTSCPTTGGSADGADCALTGRPSDPFGPGLTVLQWNCRSYRQHGSELKRRLAASAHPPDIILQEARVPEPKIVGYRAFNTPTIIVAQKGPRRKGDAQGTIPVPQAHAHVLLKKLIPAAQLDTSCYSSEQREVTAVSARLGDKDIVVVSVYWRPHSTTNDEDAEWLKLLCTRTTHPLPVLIGGDFKAHHTSWGSKSNTVRGRSVADNALVAGLVLANSPDAVTRRADSQQQDSTSPDVTWHSPSLRCSWAVVDDTWGSDHFPIIIGLGGKSRALATRTVSTTRWDDFREVLAELPPHEPLFNRIIQAKEIVTRSVKVSAEAPTPDQHLLNLWESRIKAQHCYLEDGKLPPDRTRFNRASAEAKRYSLELSRKEWHDHCTSFNGRTSPAKVWATMRGMTKNQRQQTAGEDMALRVAISNEEFASKAGPVFFPQECPASYDPAKVRFSFPPPQEPMDPGMERPFTMAELQGALFSITKLHGAPGPDMITVTALRNLPEAAMQELLDIFNESWELGQLPAIWRHASVIPIPKPGRTPKQLTDMRPISLTSHVGKLMERMALMRFEWHIEANNVLHLCQTGFRRGLSTQDSLAHGSELKRRLAASAHPPDIILQEARVPEPKIVGYRAFNTPTIIVAQKGPRRKGDAQGTIPVPQAHAHVLLKKLIPAAQLDTSCYSSEQREVTAVSARLGDKDIVVVSVYWRPHSTTNDEDAEWLKLLCTRTTHPLPVLIGGDFKAHHTSWGSKSNTVRGRSVADNALVAGLVLANSPDAVTRRADSQQQDSTSPDVTWHSPSLRCSWAVVDDTWGSDHFPIIIGLGGKSRALATRTVSTTRWDDFREVLAELPPHEPLFNRIIQAKEIVTRSVKVSAEAPTPDQHLLNLWESRIKAQHCYLEDGKLPPDRTRFNRASAEAKRYSLELSRKEWHDHCTSFNGRTSPAKVWATMRGMTKNQRQQTAGEDMALRVAISNEEFASKAGPVFFPQECPASYDPAKVRFSFPPPQEPMDPGMERPFTMAELQGALFSITKLHGAPGPDMITVTALRNLPEAAMQELLDIFNESWELGQLPAIWRHASVIPIPKPGRTPKQLTDMRPISLTSHVGKLMERMALMRFEWHIEANNVLHLCQTGFRRDVKKAFDSVPHPTVMAAASAAGLTGKPLQYIRAFLNGAPTVSQ